MTLSLYFQVYLSKKVFIISHLDLYGKSYASSVLEIDIKIKNTIS